MTAVVWIRRSLREKDNTALVEASKAHDEIIPFYTVDENYFRSADLGYPRVKFWRDSLKELQEKLREKDRDLIIRKGKPVEQLKEIVEETGSKKIYFNRDYSPYARKRDRKVENLDIEVETFKDTVIFEKDEILTNSGKPYKVYSYYAKKWFEKRKRRPEKVEDYSVPNIGSEEIPSLDELGFQQDIDVWEGGRKKGLERLEEFKEKISDYDKDRDYAWKDSTSKLSPHLKFGTISIREAFWMAERIKARNPKSEGPKVWQEELAWRDFYFQLLWNHPETKNKAFREKYRELEWRSRKDASKDWNRFTEGKTGYPFIDAGMRQLKNTGWMHNRLRMVVTSFACKDLWLDWRDLHEYFSKMFVDAETASMIGGIQWAYSIGTDAQPYFRVFNPWSQGERYDPDGEYIREWVPELRKVPDKYIHRPAEMPEDVQKEADCIIGSDYPSPIVDHSVKREQAIKKFEAVDG